MFWNITINTSFTFLKDLQRLILLFTIRPQLGEFLVQLVVAFLKVLGVDYPTVTVGGEGLYYFLWILILVLVFHNLILSKGF